MTSLARCRNGFAGLFTAIALGLLPAPGIERAPQEASTIAAAGEVPVVLASPPASTWKELTFDEIEPSAAEDYVAMVRKEMRLYSREFIERSGLKAIVVVQNLKVNGQPRAVAPDPYKQVMYCDPTIGAHHPLYQRHALHHDLFHFLMGRWENNMYFKDPQWIAICGPDVKWGDGGVNAQQGDQYAMIHPAPGFVNLYSQSAVEEDMSEIFAILRIPEELELVAGWARTDQVLAAKLTYMRRLVDRYLAPRQKQESATRPAA